MFTSYAFATNDITVTIDGQRVAFQGQPPVIITGRTLVPVRGVFETLGFNVNWNSQLRQVTLTRDDDTIVITIDSSVFTHNGVRHTLDVPAQTINGRTLLPIRALVEAVGYNIRWNGTTATVLIFTYDIEYHEEANLPTEAYNIIDYESVEYEIAGGLEEVIEVQITSNRQSIEYLQRAKTSITLPNRRLTDTERNQWISDYRAHGGATANEREVIRLVNIERQAHGLEPVVIDDRLMMAARFFAQQANDIDERAYAGGSNSHNFGPYALNPSARHGASEQVARAFGNDLGRWGGGNWFSGGTMTAEALVRGWMNSPGHRNYILSPEHRYAGAGQFPGGISYLFFSNVPSVDVPLTGQGQTGHPRLTIQQTGVSNSDVTLTPDTGNHTANSQITITATANNPRVEFVNWEVSAGTAAIANPLNAVTTITIGTTNTTVRAVFRRVPHFNLSGNQVAGTDSTGHRILVNGVVGIPANDFRLGDTVTITAEPAPGWRFVSWNNISNATLRDANNQTTTIIFDQTHTMSTVRSINVTARFERIPGFSINVQQNQLTGDVNGNRITINGLSELPSHVLAVGDTLAIEAIPADGWRFVSWNNVFGAVISDVNNRATMLTLGNPNGNNSVNTNVSLSARFERLPVFSVRTSGQGSILFNGSSTLPTAQFNLGDNLQIEALPPVNNGGWGDGQWVFNGWNTNNVNATFANPESLATTIIFNNPIGNAFSGVNTIHISANWAWVIGQPEVEVPTPPVEPEPPIEPDPPVVEPEEPNLPQEQNPDSELPSTTDED